jgi:hypothetical protein
MARSSGNNPKKKAPKKKATKKPVPKKKSTKKKATKKKTTRKKATKKRPKRARPRIKDDELPAPLDVDVQVWESYSRLRSRAKVAQELGLSEYMVRKVLDKDPGRLYRVLDSYAEVIASEREEIERRGLGLVYGLMDVYEGYIVSIKTAANKNNAGMNGVTDIHDKDGVPMTVMNAIEFLVCSRSFAQLVDMITKLRKDINDYRGGQQTSAHADDAAKTSGQGDKFEDMDPMQLAEILEQGGAKLPGILSRLRKQVENTKEKPAGRV